MYVSVVCMSICLCMDRGHTLCLVPWNSVSSLSLELINPATLAVRHLLWECLPALPAPALLGLQTCHSLVFYVGIEGLSSGTHDYEWTPYSPNCLSRSILTWDIFFGEGFPVSLVWVLIALASIEATMMTILMCVFVNKKKSCHLGQFEIKSLAMLNTSMSSSYCPH